MLQKILTFGYRFLIRHKALKKQQNISEANLEANRAFEEHARESFYKRRFVTDQRVLGSFKLGNSDMGYAGCEIIAVFNACELCRNMMDKDKTVETDTEQKDDMLLLDKIRGDYIPFSDMINEAETGGYLMRFGKWGTNPLWLPPFASKYGIGLEKLDRILPEKQGIYILSFWNDRKVKSGVHTACIQIVGDTVVTYNLFYGNSPINYEMQKFGDIMKDKRLIAVYRVHPQAYGN